MEIRDVHALLGRTAYDVDGDRLGTVTGAYVDDTTGRPSWMTVERGGLFRSTRTFVPLDGVELVDDGVRAGVSADAVRAAPHVDEDRVLTLEQEQELVRHYGLDRAPAPVGEEPVAATSDAVPDAVADTAPGDMVLTEEQVRVRTTTVPTTRAVLRRTRVVEDRTFSVPLGRDEVQVVHEPLGEPDPAREATPPQAAPPQAGPSGTGASPGDADDGWVVLYEERLVVRTEWVPVERVRLGTVGVQSEEVLRVDLRRERVDVDVEPARDPRPAPDDPATRP